MPRQARAVFSGVPHLVTQRGNRGEPVFFNDDDRSTYLTLLQEYCAAHRVEILAYCLMPHQAQLVAIPATDDGLQQVMKPLHMRHAQRVNRAQGWTGHLWQGRFLSSALDNAHVWAAVRYVEREPVRAGVVRKAENFKWSSAAAHTKAHPRTPSNSLLNSSSKWSKAFAETPDWAAWLAEGDEAQELNVIRRNIEKGLPCGSDAFVKKLSLLAGRTLKYRPLGRPRLPEVTQ
jgi:putative transposase